MLSNQFSAPDKEVPPSEAATEPNFVFATPSDAFGGVIPESPAISSAPPMDDSYQASFSPEVDFMEPKTSTPNENDSDDAVEAVEEEKVESDVNEEEMLTDDDDSETEFKSFAADKGCEKQVSADAMPSGLLRNVMEISEDESEKLEVSDDEIAVSNESFASAANESFFSTHTQHSLNTSNVSFCSALDATLIEDDDDDDEDPGCPITKKRRAEISMVDSFETPEVDYLSEQFSPSKFWAPPALSKISRQPEPSTSNVDLR
jgi:hypothetical protein